VKGMSISMMVWEVDGVWMVADAVVGFAIRALMQFRARDARCVVFLRNCGERSVVSLRVFSMRKRLFFYPGEKSVMSR